MNFKVRMVLALASLGIWGAFAVETAQIALAGEWQVRVGNQQMAVAPNELVQVKGERWESVPVAKRRCSGWQAGRRLSALIAYECSVCGALVPSSVMVKKLDGTVLECNKDYFLQKD